MATKSETIQAVADRAGVSKKDAENILGAFFDHTAERIKKRRKNCMARLRIIFHVRAWSTYGKKSSDRRGNQNQKKPLNKTFYISSDETVVARKSWQTLRLF